MDSIVKLVGNRFPKNTQLTQAQIEVYEEGYFKYATNLWKKISMDNDTGLVIFEKMLQPFEYWLRERILIEDGQAKGASSPPAAGGSTSLG